MENDTRKRAVRIGWRTALLSAGLSLALVLGACGDSTPVTDQGVGTEDTTVVDQTDQGVVDQTDEAVVDTGVETDTEAAVETNVDQTTSEETEVMTDTEVIVDTDVITETELVTETIVTTVMTDTEIMTDTGVVTETGNVSETTMDVTPTPEQGPETAIVTDTETVVVTATVVVDGEQQQQDQGAQPTPTPAAQGSQQQSQDTQAAGTAVYGVVVGVTDAPDQFVRASVLTDYSFENVNGESIGDINDLLIDLNDGAVLFVSVEYGGFLDLGDRDIYLPLSAFTVGQDGGLYLTMAEDELDAYPEVDNNWPDFNDPNWSTDINNYWTGVGVQAPDMANRTGANAAWASDLIGYPMIGWADLQTSIMDLLINLQSGKAEYALVADDTIATDGPYVVPIQSLTFDRAGQQVAFEGEINDNVVTNAPRLDPNTYPDGTAIDGTYRDDVNNTWRDLGFDWWNGE